MAFRKYPSLELALMCIFAYFPYVIAEGVGMSGAATAPPSRQPRHRGATQLLTGWSTVQWRASDGSAPGQLGDG